MVQVTLVVLISVPVWFGLVWLNCDSGSIALLESFLCRTYCQAEGVYEVSLRRGDK